MLSRMHRAEAEAALVPDTMTAVKTQSMTKTAEEFLHRCQLLSIRRLSRPALDRFRANLPYLYCTTVRCDHRLGLPSVSSKHTGTHGHPPK